MSQYPKDSKRIDEEIVCIEACRHVLTTQCNCVVPATIRIEDDPPDFEITLNDEVYPVEVTSIAANQTIVRHAQSKRLAKEINDQASRDRILTGSYGVFFTRGIKPPKNTSARGRTLLSNALYHILQTQNISESNAEILMTAPNGGTISIQKFTSQGASVGEVIIDVARRECETVTDLIQLIQGCIDKKLQTLTRKNVRVDKTLLLLYDAHGYATVDLFLEALQSVSRYEEFHSLFLALSFTDRRNELSQIEPGREGVFLFSRNTDWRGKSTVPSN